MTIYQARINRRIRNVKVYSIQRRIGQSDNFLTRLFMRIFAGKGRQESGSATDRLG